MAHPYPPSQTSLSGYLNSALPESSPLSSYNLFGPGQYPESVALWHNPAAQPHPHPQSQPGLGVPTPPASYTSAPNSSSTPSTLQPALDHKKHKRTRSGCFTCRARRIKCDESRPTCDRCRKGNRDCVYPSPGSTAPASKSGSRSGTKPKAPRPPSHGSDSSGLVEYDEIRALETIADEDEEDVHSVGSSSRFSPSARTKPGLPRKHSTQSLRKRQTNQLTPTSTSETPFSGKDASSSPSTEASSRFESTSARSASVGLFSTEPLGLPSTAHLPEDLQFYLSFYQDSLTYRHFFLRHTSEHFVRHSVIELALQYDPLLYAVVGFSAYHHCVQTGTGKLYSFLKHYNTALKLLRKSLGTGESHSEATLITVLVLTTFEEFIGDWVNLIDHHQAAHSLIRELLTPESITMNELHSHIFLWYARFDVVAGILAGNEAVLSREWYIAREQFDEQQAAAYPDDAEKQLALAASINRRFGLEMASLYAKLSRGMIPIEQFMVQNDLLGQTIERIRIILERFTDSEYTVWDYPNRQPLTDDDVVDPYVPGLLHTGPLWDVNIIWIDYLSTKQMYKYQCMLSLKQSSFEELGELSMRQCQLIESIVRWPEKENGWMYAFKNSVGMVALFGPKDEKHVMWSRRKFALLEQNGYVIAPKFRQTLATVFQLPELNHWWLPNDEGYPEIFRDVRTMTEERTTNPRDDFRESVRDMRSLFWNISLDDTESENSPASTASR
ncbi:hypothetical protein FE257_010042 [Aspergillus nanangensis]|uniref:Zn(2)-C6 fungal-type domain-containing protein n=1 Tax=Aspergillus nanangensis TaxID=2582783 RepID=A0AAD4CWR6_ASPNN|nr:hypothetical protein FE257_010042 [Aspergillus nanangensis]